MKPEDNLYHFNGVDYDSIRDCADDETELTPARPIGKTVGDKEKEKKGVLWHRIGTTLQLLKERGLWT